MASSKKSFWLVILLLSFLLVESFNAQELPASENRYPVVIAEVENLNDFALFATSGWDGNWYVGYNHAWVTKLPRAPEGNYVKAYLGAKLGRAKNVIRKQLERAKNHFQRLENLPEEKREASAKQLKYESFQEISKKIKELEKRLSSPHSGKIYIGINSSTRWDKKHSFFLISEEDIPLEGDPEEALEEVGEARWFWVEIPPGLVSFDEENYVAIWSPDENLNSAQVSPILASAWGSKEVNTWLDQEAKGKPPSSLSRSVTIFEPALAIKLVPPNEKRVSVEILDIGDGEEIKEKRVITASVSGEDIVRAWLEVSRDESTKQAKKWAKTGKLAFGAPYSITLDAAKLGESIYYLRMGAEDFWGNVGYSRSIKIAVKK
ncbi:MAG: hypothetical protein OEY92_01030 [Elusimicrobiota bacterium]|nr:hypothetical protein [Elusimicrobiota bacterium]